MDNIRINITGERQAGLKFEEFPDDLYDDLRREIDALTHELLGLVQAATPSHTGRLRSQERARIFTDKNRITGYIDVAGEKGTQDFAKAAAEEYGAHRKTKVSAHSMKLDHAWGEMLNAPITVMVAAYERTPNIAERAFERGPLAVMQPQIIARLNDAVSQAVAKANE